MSESINIGTPPKDLYLTYLSQYKNYKRLRRQMYRPLYVQKLLKCIYIVILFFTIKYAPSYLQQNYELFVGKADAIIFSIFIGFVLCGFWAILLKIITHFLKKSMHRKLPSVVEQRQSLHLLKIVLIDSFQRDKDTPLSKPYDSCPSPPQLKSTWKKHEGRILENELIILEEDIESIFVSVLMWFVMAIFFAIITILVILAIYLFLVIFSIAALAVLIVGWFVLHSPHPEYGRYRHTAGEYKPRNYSSSHLDLKQSPRLPNKSDEAKKVISNLSLEIRNTKKLLNRWGLSVYDI